MEVASRSRLDMKVKAEDDSGDVRMADDKPTYRSWKKKYRKMRVIFDQKMHDGEELHKLEQKALATARRLAVQKDRLLDLLLDVNNSAQIPTERRIDLSLDLPSDDDALFLDIDEPSTARTGPTPANSYKALLRDVPHSQFSSAAERFPDLVADLEAGRDSPADPAQGQNHPPSFLTADDLDNYIYELDMHLAAAAEEPDTDTAKVAGPPPLPTLAPLAHLDRANPRDSQRDFAVRNPTSVYNWLRKHAPKTFLQDGEHEKETAGGKEHGDDHGHGHGHGSGRRGKGERAPRGSGSTRGKRGSAAHGRSTAAAATESFEDADDGGGGGPATPSTVGAGKGKRKRVIDDDPGYRPKGGSSRPTKKKRRSEGGGEGTPTGKWPADGPRKSGSSAGYPEWRTPGEKGSASKGARKSSIPSRSARRDDD
ncbi:IEC3 subunit of the Ino80 complex, chromatin re-modelling-domain-containing protein [Staphylotrichum tortipilum]|uniref:IEC3 subunit of the Ino80 complex, chromatin re-modelling-domain-containing protein n=1 Tax=Staphylotrichum tortipilum TaxID=2831512 RepID=A0AAN6RXQ3_9PEZI|nr:IEC3 subunit of the Ino80 complex, chromatin re-modelling-domain-containing protein [Staphylotrichum longicolle]